MKIGVVLEGGGMRGMYTSGVLDVLMDEKLPIKSFIGVSAGTLFGVNYVSGQKGRALRYNLKYANNLNYMSFLSLLLTGNIINDKFAFHKVPEELDVFDDDKFMKSDIDFYATVTNINDGKPYYIKIDSVFKQMELLRATSAMPYVSKLVNYENEKYLDGGIGDSIPVLKMKEMGYDKIIVVLTRPNGYRKKKSNQFISKLFYHKYPNLIKSINERYINYNKELDIVKDLEDKGEIFVIRPSKYIKIHRVEHRKNKLQEMYDLGIEDAKNNLDKLKEYIIE